VTDREVLPECAGKTCVGMWGYSWGPKELPGVGGPGLGEAGRYKWHPSVPVTLSTQCSWCILNGSMCVMIRNLGLSVHGSVEIIVRIVRALRNVRNEH
jgi:hypothetical protein